MTTKFYFTSTSATENITIDVNETEIYIVRQENGAPNTINFNFTNVEEGDTLRIVNSGSNNSTFGSIQVNSLLSSFFPNQTLTPQINEGDVMKILFVRQPPLYSIITLIANIDSTL